MLSWKDRHAWQSKECGFPWLLDSIYGNHLLELKLMMQSETWQNINRFITLFHIKSSDVNLHLSTTLTWSRWRRSSPSLATPTWRGTWTRSTAATGPSCLRRSRSSVRSSRSSLNVFIVCVRSPTSASSPAWPTLCALPATSPRPSACVWLRCSPRSSKSFAWPASRTWTEPTWFVLPRTGSTPCGTARGCRQATQSPFDAELPDTFLWGWRRPPHGLLRPRVRVAPVRFC